MAEAYPTTPTPADGYEGRSRDNAGAPLDRETLQSTLRLMVEEARQYIETEIEPNRKIATDYFFARPLGNEEEGRSKVVMSTVRDTVLALMPDIMRVLYGSERPVEYEPHDEGDVEAADEKTDYVRYIIDQDNPGFMAIYDAVVDALLRKIGVVKSYWEVRERVDERRLTGLNSDQLDELLLDDELEIEVIGGDEKAGTYDVSVVRRKFEGREVIAPVPPENVFWDRNARSFQRFNMIGTADPEMRVDDLVAMGYDRALILAHAGETKDPQAQQTDAARRPNGNASNIGDQTTVEDAETVLYVEAYTWLVLDKQKGLQLCKCCMVGDNYELLADPEPVSHHPLAGFIVFPEPHTVVGQDIFDLTKVLQEIETALMRGTLNSLTASINPRIAANLDRVNVADLMNVELGGIVRTTDAPGNVLMEFKTSFVGADALSVMQEVKDIKDVRTGVARQTQGLDADVLQSTTKQAVASSFSASQARKEMIVRMLAETGLRTLYHNIQLDIAENQDEPRIVRLRGKSVKVDPRPWNANMDVRVNVALGAGMLEDRLAVLTGAVAKQEAIIAQYGPGNIVAGMDKYVATINRIIAMSGWQRPGNQFFNEITPQQAAQMKPVGGDQPPAPDPASMAVAQAEMMKVQLAAKKQEADIAARQQELAMRQQEIQLMDDRERDKQAATTALAITELELKHGSAVDKQKVEALIQRERAALDAATRVKVAEIQAEAKPAPKKESE